MEEILRLAAFGDDPGAARLLRGKAGSGSARVRLLAGIVAGAEGRYAAAATLLTQLMAGEDRVVAAHAAAAYAAHRRQLGGHAAALPFDGLAVAYATSELGKSAGVDPDGLDAEGALVDGLLGLAADNLGLGRLRAARLLRAKAGDRLSRAEAAQGGPSQVSGGGRAEAPGSAPLGAEVAVGRPEAAQGTPLRTATGDSAPEAVGGAAATDQRRPEAARGAPSKLKAGSWRGRVRAGWVGAEIELAAGNAAAAVAPAEGAAALAQEHGAVRHGIKSDLVLGTALAAAGASAERQRALDLVRNARLAAEKYELCSLIWPAALISADLIPANGPLYRSRADTVLHAVLLRADPGGRRLARDSPWVPV